MRIARRPRAVPAATDYRSVGGISSSTSVQIAGVLLVFSLLVVPTVMGGRLYDDSRRQYIYTPLLRR